MSQAKSALACYVCGEPATSSYNVAAGAASSVPSRMEPVCEKHNPLNNIPMALRDQVATGEEGLSLKVAALESKLAVALARAEAAERRVVAVEETLRAVRLDLWTASIHLNPQSMFDAYAAAEAKIDALLGSVSAEERLETLFPNLRHDAGQEGDAGGS